MASQALPTTPAAEEDTRSHCSSAATTIVMGDMEADLKVGAVHSGNSKCCTCGDLTNPDERVIVRASSKNQPETVFRCKGCHNLKSRMNRIMAKNGQLARDWSEMGDVEKTSFITSNRGLRGAELELRLTETAIISKTKRSSTSFTAEGHYLSAVEIREKYEKQPQVAESIIKNARSFFDAVKQVHVYEDVSYTAKQQDEEVREEVNRMRMEAGPNAVLDDARGNGGNGGNGNGGNGNGGNGAGGAATAQTKNTSKGRKNKKDDPDNVKTEEKPKKVAKVKVNKQDKAFGKKYVSLMAPMKVELAGLKEKTSGNEHLYPAHVLTYAQQSLSKLDSMYVVVEPIFKGEKTVEDVNSDRAVFEEEVKNVVGEATLAIERLRVQVSEVGKLGK